ncbi:hypothetical protein, partial [Herbiconiux daphne]
SCLKALGHIKTCFQGEEREEFTNSLLVMNKSFDLKLKMRIKLNQSSRREVTLTNLERLMN